MKQKITVSFKKIGKTNKFKNTKEILNINDIVIVQTSRGTEYGHVISIKDCDLDSLSGLKEIIRKANDDDLTLIKKLQKKENEAFSICLKKINEHDLPMKLIDVEFFIDNTKILFYFTSDIRIDFRNLVKDLAAIFKNRIELRQIGVRDEAKMIGGISICGRELCCSSFLKDFQPVSIKMAKEQNLSLNPTKISGACGRLMCCLKYEQETYEDLIKITPRVGTLVKTSQGEGNVIEVNLLTGLLKIMLEKNKNSSPIIARRDEVEILKEPEEDHFEIPEELIDLE